MGRVAVWRAPENFGSVSVGRGRVSHIFSLSQGPSGSSIPFLCPVLCPLHRLQSLPLGRVRFQNVLLDFGRRANPVQLKNLHIT